MKHFELTTESKVNFLGITLFRIKALIDLKWSDGTEVKSGELGGWVSDDGRVFGNGWVFGDGEVFGDGRVYGNGKVFGDGKVYGNGKVFGDGEVFGDGKVYGNGRVSKTSDYIVFQNVGSRIDTLTCYRAEVGIELNVGCFSGTLEAFAETVTKIHKESNPKAYKEYSLIIEIIKNRFDLGE